MCYNVIGLRQLFSHAPPEKIGGWHTSSRLEQIENGAMRWTSFFCDCLIARRNQIRLELLDARRLAAAAQADDTVVEGDAAWLTAQGAHREAGCGFLGHVQGAVAQGRQEDVVGPPGVDRLGVGCLPNSITAWPARNCPLPKSSIQFCEPVNA